VWDGDLALELGDVTTSTRGDVILSPAIRYRMDDAQQVSLLGTWIGLLIGTVAISLRGSTLERPDWRHFAAGFVLSTAAILSMAPIFGPFVLIPVLVSVNTIAYAITALPTWRRPTIFAGALAVLLPVLWEQLGWFAATSTFTDGSLRISSAVIEFPPAMTLLVLSLSMVALVAIPALFMSRIRDGMAAAERALQLQSWHLRQLIPAQAQDAIAPGLDESPGPLLSCPIDQHFHKRGH
jgi:hypothetical protein